MMRSLVLGLVLAAWACAHAPAVEKAAKFDGGAVADEVISLLDQQVADWNAGDLEGFVSVYADDAVFLSPSGVQRGRQQIFDRYVKRYRSDGKEMGTLTLEPIDTRVSGDGNVASIALRWKLEWTAQEPASGLSLITLHRHDGRWVIQQDASMSGC